MYHFDNYIATIDNQELISTIKNTSDDVISSIRQRISEQKKQINGLLLGHVQSGKTAQMLGIISKMADAGYNLFLILTSDNIDLHRQTYKRFQNSLTSFNVISENDETSLDTITHNKPLIIVLKKNSKTLKRWRNVLVNRELCYGQILTIFDDEADNASLNTLINKRKRSPINNNLKDIKETAVTTIYMEVTATPQSLLLQTTQSGWKPEFISYFEPGKSYLGGNYFYSIPKSFCVRYTDEYELNDVVSDDDVICPEGLKNSTAIFLVICAYFKSKQKSNCNFLVHPSSKINIQEIFVQKIREHLNLLQNASEDEGFNEIIYNAWSDLQSTKPDIGAFEDIKQGVIDILDNEEIFSTTLNSQNTSIRDCNNPDALDLSKGFNIIVGGNTLGRGLTFPHLQVVYYCRTSQTPQADTFWQHSRIFGYDRIPELVRLFIPPLLYQLFTRLNP